MRIDILLARAACVAAANSPSSERVKSAQRSTLATNRKMPANTRRENASAPTVALAEFSFLTFTVWVMRLFFEPVTPGDHFK
jgi:hypothetical protein